MSRTATLDAFPISPVDVRLIVSDMDGTLLDGQGQLPVAFWPMLERLRNKGILFAIASGRQYLTLRRIFGSHTDDIAFVAENGAYVVHDGVELSSQPVARSVAERFVRAARDLTFARGIGIVWCGRASAYIERRDPDFVREVARHFAHLELVDDLLDVEEEALKFTVYDANGAEASLPILRTVTGRCRAVASAEDWIDVMPPLVDKGVALRSLQKVFGVTPEQTVVFADYLNDLEMLAEAEHTFAMANAHPEVICRARYLAPSNDDHGVMSVVSRLLDLSVPASHVEDDVAAVRQQLGVRGVVPAMSWRTT